MADYITKEKVKEENLSWARCINNPERLVTEDTLYVIDALPAADVRPVVRGRWIICSDGYYPFCSNCKQEPPGREMTDFCPNCGADMREETIVEAEGDDG